MGNEAVDSQHKKMFELINELYTALQEGQDENQVRKMIDRACQYAPTHFKAEEALLAKAGYPHLDEHKQVHKEYIRQVEQIRENSKTSVGDMAFELFVFLKEWWLNHITQMDCEYGPELKKHLQG